MPQRIRLAPHFILFIALLTGCGTPKQRFIAVGVPSDKALLYVIWEHQFLRMAGVAIHVNGQPRAVLHTGGYYPLIIDGGTNSLGYSFIANPMIPFRVAKEGMLDLLAQPGQTYFVTYRPWSGTWYPQLVQLEPGVGMRQITNCTLCKEWKKSD